jgi:hypothetical protein
MENVYGAKYRHKNGDGMGGGMFGWLSSELGKQLKEVSCGEIQKILAGIFS